MKGKRKIKLKKIKEETNDSCEEKKENEFLDKFSYKNLSYLDYIEKEITSDGNCFFRAISYYFREDEDNHFEFRRMLNEWLLENKSIFIEMIPEENEANIKLSYDERISILTRKIERIKTPKYWAGDLEISAMCLMLNINIYLYIKDDLTYKLYWKFETNEEPTEIIYMLFINNNHFELLYKKIIFLNIKKVMKIMLIKILKIMLKINLNKLRL